MSADEVLRYINAVVYGGLAAAAWRVHRRLRSERSRWLLITFAALAGVIVLGLFLPRRDEGGGLVVDVVRDLSLAALLLFPYGLFRFAAGFRRPPRWVETVALVWFVALVVTTFAMPPLPSRGGDYTTAQTIYVLVLGAYWAALSLWVAVQLWRGGRGQPGVARRRMKFLGTGAVILTVALLLAVANAVASGGGVGGVRILTTVLAWISAAFFIMGFAPPAGLRRAWRQNDERHLRRAEARLMSATSAVEVADTIIPHVSELLGGHGAALLDSQGRPLASRGFSEAALAEAAHDRGETINRERLVLPLEAGTLVIEANQYTPFFGQDEIELLRSLGTFIDLALARIALYEQELSTRKELELTNAELTALVYGISHDLRSPIVTVIGYLELLSSDAGHKLTAGERHYLERISISARYMDSLIRDLLELSRIGRTQTEKEAVDLGALIEDIAAELRRDHPAARFVVDDLPTLRMNAVRARQLFTNLMENAVRHGGRDDITVSVSGETADDGAVVSVADDGVGIAEPYRERVFGLFEQLDSGLRDDATGTGIGLAVCRKIVEQNDGSIWIHPSTVGTTFKIAFPAAAMAQSDDDDDVEVHGL